jgi:hypothetical protein
MEAVAALPLPLMQVPLEGVFALVILVTAMLVKEAALEVVTLQAAEAVLLA